MKAADLRGVHGLVFVGPIAVAEMTGFKANASALLVTLGVVFALLAGPGRVSARADEFRARYQVSLIG
ncbi:MAG: hypothetical protein ACREV8_02075, partial [Gammaproteobacteria bacterium]